MRSCKTLVSCMAARSYTLVRTTNSKWMIMYSGKLSQEQTFAGANFRKLVENKILAGKLSWNENFSRENICGLLAGAPPKDTTRPNFAFVNGHKTLKFAKKFPSKWMICVQVAKRKGGRSTSIKSCWFCCGPPCHNIHATLAHSLLSLLPSLLLVG